MSYETTAFSLSASVHSIFSQQRDAEDTNRQSAIAGFSLSYFRFKQWEFDTFYLLYPSLTETGRVRQSLNAQLRLRLIRGKPFWLNISQTLDLDSEPPENTPGTDYVTTMSLSWTFP